MRCATYRKGQRQHPDATLAEASTALHAGAVDFVWLHLTDPTAATRKRVAAELGAGHALDRDGSSQDAAALAGEESAEFARFVVGFPQFVAGNRPQVTEHGSLMLVVGRHVLITVERAVTTAGRGALPPADELRATIEQRPAWLALGPWAVTHTLIDTAIDRYAAIAEQLGAEIDDMDVAVFDAHGPTAQRIYQLKRALVTLKRIVGQLTRPLDRIARRTVDGVPSIVQQRFIDAADQHHRTAEQLASLDDLLSSVLSASLTLVSVQQNNDMRKISAWAAIIGAQTTIAGIYGMNFEHMPELTWRFGYPIILLVMVAVAVLFYRWFRRSGWL